MAFINDNFLKLRTGYLFPEVARRVRVFQAENPKAKLINLGIGDVTGPLPRACIEAMKRAVDDMANQKRFHGYGPEQGYDFLIDAIIKNDFNPRGIQLDRTEVFISDGAKCDIANIQEIFSTRNIVAIPDPVYPVYVDSNVMAGRTGQANEKGQYDGIVYMPALEDNNFIPQPPNAHVDIIYLCFPNNPTGAVATKEILAKWVDFARGEKAVIFFDAAYEAFITDPNIPHSIYEIEGAKEVAIEFRSFSKTAGFTGIRCAFTIVPHQLKAYTKNGEVVQLNGLWHRRHTTKFNGASYISQVGAAAIYTPAGKEQIRQIINTYMNNAALIRQQLTGLGYKAYGGVNAPYIWVRTPDRLSSWEFFDYLLRKAHIITTPGSGFGSYGEGFLRLSAFAKPDDIKEAMQRMAEVKN